MSRNRSFPEAFCQRFSKSKSPAIWANTANVRKYESRLFVLVKIMKKVSTGFVLGNRLTEDHRRTCLGMGNTG